MMVAKNIKQGLRPGELLQGYTLSSNLPDIEITGLCLDSRRIQPGDAFIALMGTQQDGARYIQDAIEKGASCVFIDAPRAPDISVSSTDIIAVRDLRRNLGYIAARFFEEPSSNLAVTAVTGTNGKTSIAWLLAHATNILGNKSGLIGTLGMGFIDELKPVINTTPDAISIQTVLQQLRLIECESVYMEVSSHALNQYRVDGTHFKQAIFTNLTHEHLDYHGTMQAYGDSKKRLFSSDFSAPEIILNLDDPFFNNILKDVQPKATVYGYSLNSYSTELPKEHQLIASIIEQDTSGLLIELQTPWGHAEFRSSLIGRFNVSNLLACITSLCLSGFELNEVLKSLQQTPQVPGRMESFGNIQQPRVIIDYAHSPDSLKHVLDSLREHTNGELYCVFGCGGDRDKEKRPMMAEVAEVRADYIYITSDNPRSEDPESIISDIVSGIRDHKNIIIEPDRSTAIRNAIYRADVGDVVLIAGKGHEHFQEIDGSYIPFSDRQLALRCLESLHD